MNLSPGWGEGVAARLLDTHTCPACSAAALVRGHCPRCGVDVSGPQGVEVWNASVAAAQALRQRDALVRALPRVPVPVPAPPPPGWAPPAVPVSGDPRTEGSSATLQSLLAVAGAGLFAVAAIVFTYFNPDLADRSVRSAVIALVTLVFVGGAWLLARRRLQFSAEAVGGLGLVFVGLDVHALTQAFDSSWSGWLTTALGAFIAGSLMLIAALRVGVRVWLWTSLMVLALVPMMVGAGVSWYDGGVMGSLGLVASAGVAAAANECVPWLGRVFGRRRASRGLGAVEVARPSSLRAEIVGLTVLRFAVSAAAIVVIVWGPRLTVVAHLLWVALILALIAGVAVWSTRHLIPGVWSVVAGLSLATAVVPLMMSVVTQRESLEPWTTTFIAGGIAVVIGLMARVPLLHTVRRVAMAVGVVVVAGLALFEPLLRVHALWQELLWSFLIPSTRDVIPVAPTHQVELVWSPVVALALVAAGLGAFSLLSPPDARTRGIAVFARGAAVTLGMLAVLTVAVAGALPLVVRVVMTVAVALLLGVLLRISPPRARIQATPEASAPDAVAPSAPDAPAFTSDAVSIDRAKKRWSLPSMPASVRVPLIVGAGVAVVLSVMVAWFDRNIVPYAAVGTLVALAVIAVSVRPSNRFIYTGLGYAYALVAVGTALSLIGFEGVPLWSLTVSVGLVVTIAATFITRIHRRHWLALLVVTTVPFLWGIAQVVFERSGWTAISTSLMFVLALSLLVTRRPGLTAPVRVVAAGILVPTLAVTIVCLGAQLLVGSGSPVVLPIIGVVVAAVLPAGILIRDALVTVGRSPETARAARGAIEVSALVTGAIAVLLAIARPAAGWGTACVTLILIGLGATLASLITDRRYTWWVAGIAFTGALWSMWGLADVTLPEAYLLPPTLVAALVGLLLTVRGRRGMALYATGLLGAIVPLVVIVIVSSAATGTPWRAYGLLAGGVALGVASAVAARARNSDRRSLTRPTALAAGAAATAATVQAMRWGFGIDAVPYGAGAAPLHVLLLALALGSVSGAVWAVAAAARSRAARHAEENSEPLAQALPVTPATIATPATRERSIRNEPGTQARVSHWLGAPAVLALVLSAWPAIARDPGVIGIMWGLMLAVLVAMVIAAARPRTVLPPVWFLFAIAFITGVVAWSPRELRVEAFSLPMGAFLLIAGLIGVRAARATTPDASGANSPPSQDRGRLNAWPHGFRHSWALLAPGLIVMMSASIVATFTDPLTWRAILVMVLALGAILLGAWGRLAAPFIIGLIVLPIENVFVFAVQLGRGIESMPWWITLAVIGAVLLIIAVAGERNDGSRGGVAARLRDLR